jgi:short subunit dehydrogenase-like uncharacterized protein
MPGNLVAVFGPTGYTGRLVLAELRRRDLIPLLVGRDRRRLDALAERDEVRIAELNNGDALRTGFDGASAVINCVGPFALSRTQEVAGSSPANSIRKRLQSGCFCTRRVSAHMRLVNSLVNFWST